MNKPTEAQLRAIEATDRSVAVVASAGSGKTTVLIDRCRRLIGDDASELDRILAITFTEKAAAELKARLRATLPRGAHHCLTTAWIGTFHGCSARMLRQHAPLANLDPAFTILDENASQLIARQTIRTAILAALEDRDPEVVRLVDALDFRNATRLIEELMDFRWHARRSLAEPRSDDDEERTLLKATAHAYDLCEGAYLESLAGQDAVDFQEIEIRALKLLADHPDIRAAYQRRFRHILIDEFQDTNDVQMELVLMLYAPGMNTLCIVGDPRQSIYRFRGANVDCFQNAMKTIRRSDGTVVPLTHNFRSRPGIVDFVNDASEHMSEGLFGTHPDDELLTPAAERMRAFRSDDAAEPDVVALDLASTERMTAAQRRRCEARAIASYIEDLVEGGRYAFGDVVCLFQALTNTVEYEIAFKAKSIPYRFYGGRGMLDRQEICDLMHALRYAANPHDDVALLGLLRSPLIGISDEECVRLAGPHGDALREQARAHPACKLLRSLEQLSLHRLPSEIMRRVLDQTGYEYALSQLDPSGGMRSHVDRLVMIAEDLERQTPTTLDHFIGFIGHLRERSARLGDPPAAGDRAASVRCMTVHTAKGLEFPVVVLPDLFRQEPTSASSWIFHRHEGCAFKLKDPDHPFGARLPTARYDRICALERYQASAEHARLLYVAMTRARDVLVLPLHRDEKLKGRWHEWLKPIASSRALVLSCSGENKIKGTAEIQTYERTSARTHHSTKIRTYARASARAHQRARARVFSVSQLEAYDRCPHEYYLKYVLRLPAANLLKEEGACLAANVRGSIVHDVLEKLTPRSADALDELIEAACLRYGVFPEEAVRREIVQPIRTYMTTSLFGEADTGRRETRFDWRLGRHAVTGYIDWYRENPDGFDIVDFKTDQVDEGGVSLRAQEYELQMLAYALALEEASRQPVASTTLVFLTPNVVRSVRMDEARRKDGMNRLERITALIEEDAFSLAGITPPCYKCPYHHNGLCWEDRLADYG